MRHGGSVGRIAQLLSGCGLAVVSPGPSFAQPAAAQQSPRPLPPIEERYHAADAYMRPKLDQLIVDRDVQPHFVHDGAGLLYRQGPAAKRQWLYLDLATFQPRVLVSDATLAELLAKASGKPVKPGEWSLEDPDYDAGTATLSFQAFDKRWTYHADGTLAEATTGSQRGDDAVSPDGRYRIIARDHNLVAVETRTGRELPLTTDGTRDQPYGRGIPQLADILQQGTEDPELPVSVRWSPDSKRILTWRLDTRGVLRLGIVQPSPPGSIYPRSFSYIYPLAGAEKLPQATRYAIDVDRAFRKHRARPVQLQIPSESLLYPADPDFSWIDGQVRAQWTERGYKQLVIYRADPDTGSASVTAREAVEPLVTVTSSFLIPAPELGGELDVSERSGWAQLYLVRPDDPNGGVALTHGAWEVVSVEHVDGKAGAVLVTGVGREHDRNPYYRALYRVPVAGGDPVLLTPEPLDHEVQVSPDGRWAVDAMSSPTVPTRTVVRDTRDGCIVAELARADASALVAQGFTPPEPFAGVAADGTTPIYGMIYRPANFDPSRSYPVIDNVYTGPTTTDVATSWSGTVTSSAESVAQLGAIVVMIDGRGTSRRGRAFRLEAYQNLGEVGIDDHIALIRQMAARYPQFDLSRVGVYGGSAGGYDTARFVLRRPGFFKVGVSSSGNHDLRLDKAWWPEATMGDPGQDIWERNSNLSVAGNAAGKLLLIHGDIDDNVPVTESLRLANALIQAHRDVDLVILPNTTHRVYQPYFWRKFRDYFVRNLLDEAPPADSTTQAPDYADELPLLHPEQ